MIKISETVVADRGVVQDGGSNRPVLGDPRQMARRVLQLVHIRRRSGRHAPAPRRRIVPHPVGLIIKSRYPVLIVQDLVALNAEDVLVEHRAASPQRGVVEQLAIDDRVGDRRHLQDLRRHRVEARLRNDIAGKRLAYRDGVYVPRGPRIIDLAVDHWPAQSVVAYHRTGRRAAREGRIEEARKIALLECRNGQADKRSGPEVAHAVLLKIGKPEALVPAVVYLRNIDRTAQAVAPVEQFVRRTLAAGRIVRKAVGIESVVLEIRETRAVKLVRAGLDGEVGHAGLAAIVLRADGARLQLEFTDRLGAGAELIITAPLEIESAQRDAFDQNLIGAKLAAVDGSLECSAHCTRQAVEDELLDLALTIRHQDRPRVEFFLGDLPADVGRGALDQWGLPPDRNVVPHGAHLP